MSCPPKKLLGSTRGPAVRKLKSSLDVRRLLDREDPPPDPKLCVRRPGRVVNPLSVPDDVPWADRDLPRLDGSNGEPCRLGPPPNDPRRWNRSSNSSEVGPEGRFRCGNGPSASDLSVAGGWDVRRRIGGGRGGGPREEEADVPPSEVVDS